MCDIDTKMQTLYESYGYTDDLEMLSDATKDSIVPGICSNNECSYTNDVEPDCTSGRCEVCETQTVKSCLIMASLI